MRRRLMIATVTAVCIFITPAVYVGGEEFKVANLRQVLVTLPDGSKRTIEVPEDGDIWPGRVLVTFDPKVDQYISDARMAGAGDVFSSQMPEMQLGAVLAERGLTLKPLLNHPSLPTLTERMAFAQKMRDREAQLNPAKAARRSGTPEQIEEIGVK